MYFTIFLVPIRCFLVPILTHFSCLFRRLYRTFYCLFLRALIIINTLRRYSKVLRIWSWDDWYSSPPIFAQNPWAAENGPNYFVARINASCAALISTKQTIQNLRPKRRVEAHADDQWRGKMLFLKNALGYSLNPNLIVMQK